MKFKIKHVDQIAGALSILAIAALFFIIFLIGSTQKWFVPKHMYYTIIPTASITEGKAVTYKGFEIGKIKSIKLTDGDRVRVDFYITDEYVSKCVRDSIIEISVSPIGLGSSVIFYPGNSKALMGDGTFVPEKSSEDAKRIIKNKLIYTAEQTDSINTLISIATSLLKNVDILVKQINLALEGN